MAKELPNGGLDSGGARAEAGYSPIGSATLSGVDPALYLHHVFTHFTDHPIHPIDEVLP